MNCKANSCLLLITALLIIIAAASCKSTDRNRSSYADGKSVGRCDCNNISTDSTIICFSASGESREEMFSKERALHSAREGLASLIQTKVLAVTNNFRESETENGESENTTDRYEKAVRQVVEQTLTGMKIGCESVTKTNEGVYKTYIRLEIKEQNMKKALDKQGLFRGI